MANARFMKIKADIFDKVTFHGEKKNKQQHINDCVIRELAIFFSILRSIMFTGCLLLKYL